MLWALDTAMKSWSHFWRRSAKEGGELIRCVRLTLPGWNEDPHPRREHMRMWRNSQNEALSLTIFAGTSPCVERGNELEVRRWARGVAQGKGAGLIEVRIVDREIKFIFKELRRQVYYYTGVFLTRVSVKGEWPVWITTACELGTTGEREAIVSATLMTAGTLSPNEYELRWGQDPYEPSYVGVDRSVLRFMSDDESYDQQFPQHPLSKVRRILAMLSNHVEYDT
jgi:hypothetical protein